MSSADSLVNFVVVGGVEILDRFGRAGHELFVDELFAAVARLRLFVSGHIVRESTE